MNLQSFYCGINRIYYFWGFLGPEGSLDLAELLFALEQWEMAEITLNHVPLQDKAVLSAKVRKLEELNFEIVS